MAAALHNEMIMAGHETMLDFSRAWDLQEERRRGRHLGFSWAQRRFVYGEACSLGAQITRLLQVTTKKQVLVLVLDDIVTDARREYLRVLNFLDVQDDGRSHFPIYNTSSTLKYPSVRLLYPLLNLKARLGLNVSVGLWRRIERANRDSKPRHDLSPEMLAHLKEYFKGDVACLSKLLNRDLTGWVE